jgi:hypothetical protein
VRREGDPLASQQIAKGLPGRPGLAFQQAGAVLQLAPDDLLQPRRGNGLRVPRERAQSLPAPGALLLALL